MKKEYGVGGIITAIVFIAILYPLALTAVIGGIEYLTGNANEKFMEYLPLIFFALPIYFVAVLFLIFSMVKRYDALEANKLYYCPSCKERVRFDANVCPSCGAKLNELMEHVDKPGRKRIPAILFAVFLGGLGIHNYYLKRYKQFYKELTISIFTVGLLLPLIHLIAIIEAIRIGVGGIKYDGDGRKIS